MTKERKYVKTVLGSDNILIEIYKEGNKQIFRSQSEVYKPYVVEDDNGFFCLGKFEIPNEEMSVLNKALSKGIKS